jgi:hypothetical protein
MRMQFIVLCPSHAIASAQKTASLIGDKWMYIYQEHYIYVTLTTFSSSLQELLHSTDDAIELDCRIPRNS